MTAEQGLVQAQRLLGNIYMGHSGVPKDYAEAARWYQKAADQGDALSQDTLGFMFFYGDGVEQDYAYAMELFVTRRRKATKGGSMALVLGMRTAKACRRTTFSLICG